MKLLRKLLFPFVPVYFVITWLRNKCYDYNVFKSKDYDFPVICVGNISVGGTGKTPMIEYLIGLLGDRYTLATLSRGYKRTIKGFQIADENATALTIGDEPFQFYKKFEDITVVVDASRRHGIAKLRELKQPEVVLLDDAFQHRKVTAGINILLTSFNDLYVDDIMLPTGNLREPRSGAKRADAIVVTKCPTSMTLEDRERVVKRLNPRAYQQVFFSSISYSDTLYSKEGEMPLNALNDKPFTLVTGIANPIHLVDFLTENGYKFEHLNFKDHHAFSDAEIDMLKQKGLIITTEKDFTRLQDKLSGSMLYYLPIETKIADQKAFDALINDFVSRC